MSETLRQDREFLELFSPGWYCDHCGERFTYGFDGFVYFDGGPQLNGYFLHQECEGLFVVEKGFCFQESITVGEYAVALANSLEGVQAKAIKDDKWYGEVG